MPYIVKDKILFLSSASKILSSSLDYNVTLVSVAKLVVESVADFCMIDLFEEDALQRVTVRMYDKKKDRIAQAFYNFPPDPRNANAIYDAAKLGYPIIIKKITRKWLENVSRIKEEKQIVKKLGFRSLIFVPLISRNDVIGVMTIASTLQGFSYDEEDSIFIKELADRAAITVDKARLFTKAQEAIKTRDEFLAIASHELKTPLTSILLSLQLVLSRLKKNTNQKQANEEVFQALEIAVAKSKRMSTLIKDLLNVSLTASDYFEIYPEPVNLTGLLKDVSLNFELLLAKNKTELNIKEERENLIGNWDRVRMEQAISNLVSNAVNYGNKKPIDIITKKVKNKVFITVRDRGIGISDEDKKNIFGVFKRGDNTKKQHSGIGVGLFIALKIIEAHGGNLSVESEIGKGSSFTIKLPLGKLTPNK